MFQETYFVRGVLDRDGISPLFFWNFFFLMYSTKFLCLKKKSNIISGAFLALSLKAASQRARIKQLACDVEAWRRLSSVQCAVQSLSGHAHCWNNTGIILGSCLDR